MSTMGRKAALITALAARALPGSAASSLDPFLPALGSPDSAYRCMQGLSDHAYDLLRVHLFNAILPSALARDLKKSPTFDSFDVFEQRLLRNAGRAFPPSAGDAQTFRLRASVILDSLGQTLQERYELERFGSASGAYAFDRRNWDPGLLAAAGILGAAFLYLNGAHVETHVGKASIGIEARPGMKIRQALRRGAGLDDIFAVNLGYGNSPLSLAAHWGLRRGNIGAERVGVKFRATF